MSKVDHLTPAELEHVQIATDKIQASIDDFKNKLQVLSEKKKAGEVLTDADKATIVDAKQLVETLESKKEATDLVKKQSTELREALKDFTQNKNEIVLNTGVQKDTFKDSLLKDESRAMIDFVGLTYNDVKDLNIASALDVISKGKTGTDYDSWKQAGYNPDGFFGPTELEQLNNLGSKININKLNKYLEFKNKGIQLIDVANTQLILNNTSADEIYKVIFDADNNLQVGQSDNQNIVKFKDAYTLVETMLASGKEKALLASIGNILGQKFVDKQALYVYLKANPEAKYTIGKYMTTLASSGDSKATFVSDMLEHGTEATKKSLEKKSKVDTYLNQLFDKEKEKLDEKYTTAVSDFESKIPENEKKKYADILEALKSTQVKKELFDGIRLNGVGVLASLVQSKQGAVAGASFSSRDLDSYLKEKTSSIVSGVNFEAGFGSLGGQMVPGIGVSMDLSKEMSDETRAFGKIGIVNLIPFAMAGLETQLNADTIKSQGFSNLTDKSKYAGASVNVSTLGWGLGLHYRQDQLKGIEQKERQFSEFLNKAITENGVDMAYIASQGDYEQNKSYYDGFAKNISFILDSQNFSILPPDYKKSILSSIKTSSQFMWREGMLKEAQKNGYEFAGAGIGVQFLAGFMPLPTFGVAFEKVSAGYKENQVSRLYATLGVLLNEKKGKVVDGGQEAKMEGISIDGNSFKTHEAKFRNFAQNHPADWKKLVTGNLDFNGQVDIITKMLSSSKDSFFKATANEFKKLQASNHPSDQKKLRDLVAQFFDVSFKDKRDISQVVLGYTVAENGKYEGKYDFKTSRFHAMEKFSKSQGLQDFSTLTQSLYNEVAQNHQAELKNFQSGKQKEAPKLNPTVDKTLFGFVASYKIDGEGKSLGKGFIDIPAGQVSKVDGKEKIVTNPTDKEFIAKRFAESYYGKATWENIKKIIESKNLGIDVSKVDFAKVLTTGEIYNQDGKKIQLNSEFVTFLYGQCANESMGLRLTKLDITGFNTPPTVDLTTITPDQLTQINANTTNIVVGEKKTLGFGMIGGQEDTSNQSQGRVSNPGRGDGPDGGSPAIEE